MEIKHNSELATVTAMMMDGIYHLLYLYTIPLQEICPSHILCTPVHIYMKVHHCTTAICSYRTVAIIYHQSVPIYGLLVFLLVV